MASSPSRGKLRHIEIEHKYVVPAAFDFVGFAKRMRKLGCTRKFRVRVRDDYYWSRRLPGSILRHRFDEELQQLTLKAKGLARDARIEVNLQLDRVGGDQRDAVSAFLGNISDFKRVTVRKDVTIFLFPDCEVCYYTAQSGRRRVRCVEFEATSKSTLKRARDVLKHYETAAGFATRELEPRSLFDILVRPQIAPVR